MRSRKARGFTLLEVVIAIFLLGVTFVLFSSSLKTLAVTRSVNFEDIALRVANQKLDSLRAAGYASLPASGSFTDSLLSSIPSSSASTSITVYNAQTKKVVVNVLWQEAGKPTRNVSLSTLITATGGL